MQQICREYIRNLNENETMMTAGTQRIKQICIECVAKENKMMMTAGTQSMKQICNECVANMQGIYQKLERE